MDSMLDDARKSSSETDAEFLKKSWFGSPCMISTLLLCLYSMSGIAFEFWIVSRMGAGMYIYRRLGTLIRCHHCNERTFEHLNLAIALDLGKHSIYLTISILRCSSIRWVRPIWDKMHSNLVGRTSIHSTVSSTMLEIILCSLGNLTLRLPWEYHSYLQALLCYLAKRLVRNLYCMNWY